LPALPESQRLVMRDCCGSPKARFRCGSSRTSQSRVMVSRLVRDWSEITCLTARNANAWTVSLLRSNANRIAWERMSSRNRITVAASVRWRVGSKFCRSKSCAIFMVSTITRSELMRQNARRTLTFWVRADSLVVDPLDFNVYAITRGETRVEDWAKSDHTAIKADGCRLDPRLWNPERALC